MIQVGQLPLPTSDHLSETLENGCSGECFKSGTDYIMIKKEENRAYLTQINSSSSELHTTSVEDISAGDYSFPCNKKHINLVKATSINSGSSIVYLSRALRAVIIILETMLVNILYKFCMLEIVM
ncbi:hypothetical protein M973_01900 [Francisella orientalis LADL 07-285A]|nr:hypothetical protein [Francisella orientalis]AHB99069.1 hypothetical protein M973_01900 [Francisella orientalis LADL 07-285A]